MASIAPIAERAALAAIRADSEDPWAHLALGYVYLFGRRLDDSLAEFELALRLNPNFSVAQGYYGLALSYCGRWQEADQAASRALRLSPRDPLLAIYNGIAAYAQFVGRNYDEGDAAGAPRRCASEPISSARTACLPLRRHGRSDGCRCRRTPGTSPRPAQHLARLDRRAKCRSC